MGISGIGFVARLVGSLFLAESLLIEPGPALSIALLVASLVETFVASFFSAALVLATRTALQGREPNINAAMTPAWSRKGPLWFGLWWPLWSARSSRWFASIDNLLVRILARLFAAG